MHSTFAFYDTQVILQKCHRWQRHTFKLHLEIAELEKRRNLMQWEPTWAIGGLHSHNVRQPLQYIHPLLGGKDLLLIDIRIIIVISEFRILTVIEASNLNEWVNFVIYTNYLIAIGFHYQSKEC